MFSSLRHDFDPLDREILERAFYAALAAVEAKQSVSAFDDVKDLEAVLRGKLIEIVQTNSFSDAEALQDVLLDRLSSS